LLAALVPDPLLAVAVDARSDAWLSVVALGDHDDSLTLRGAATNLASLIELNQGQAA